MTTTTPKVTAPRGGSVLLGAGVAAVALGALAILVGGLVGGSDAALGALAGTLLVLLVFGFGSVTVHVVAGAMPSVSLVVALLTYTLQVAMMGLVLVALQGSGLLDATVDRHWLAGAVVVGTFGWLTTQVVLATRVRIPVYDHPAATTPHGREGSAR